MERPREEYWHSLLSLVGETTISEMVPKNCDIIRELLFDTATDEFEDIKGEGELNSLLLLLLEQNHKGLAIGIIRRHGIKHLFCLFRVFEYL